MQQLIELKAKYPGAINLFELKQYLEPGRIDNKIDEYIFQVEKSIRVRSHLVQLVQKCLETTNTEAVGVDTIHGAYGFSNPPQPLQIKEIHEILIELSSPLVGYLGRIKGNDWKSDRFYFLRDFPIS